MKKEKQILLISSVLVLLLLTGMVAILLTLNEKRKEEAQLALELQESSKIETFAVYTDCKVIQDIPAMKCSGARIGEATDYGDGNYGIDINGSSKNDYENYIASLIEQGYKKHSDNGENGMEERIYTTSLIKDNVSVVVSHLERHDKTYIMAAEDSPLSDYMVEQDYASEIDTNAKTKVHMLELNNNGTSFVVQLKNGHFIVEDGGLKYDAPYLLDYLEALTPDGEKPIIDAWFLSHSHDDHVGAILEIAQNEVHRERIRVEGIYFTPPSEKELRNINETGGVQLGLTKRVNGLFKKQNGEKTDMYRMHIGQRYYFCDVIIDVALTVEQIPIEQFATADFNDTSTWLMHHIDGQRMLIAGDAFQASNRLAVTLYDKEYFVMDVLAVFHHGINVYDYFTDYCTVKTALYPNWRVGSLWQDGSDAAFTEENKHLQESVDECYSRGEGTVVLTFPYAVGTAEILEPLDWKYTGGVPKRTIFK